jgi:hypothetical protein
MESDKSTVAKDLKGGELIKDNNGLGTVSRVHITAEATVVVETFGRGRTDEQTFDGYQAVKTY